jgi:hypothetical protein
VRCEKGDINELKICMSKFKDVELQICNNPNNCISESTCSNSEKATVNIIIRSDHPPQAEIRHHHRTSNKMNGSGESSNVRRARHMCRTVVLTAQT